MKIVNTAENNMVQGLLEPAGIFFLVAFSVIGGLLLFTSFLSRNFKPIDSTLCAPLLEFCALHPSIELYRAKVVEQNRTFMEGEYYMIKEAVRGLNPKDLEACKLLYNI